MCHFLGITQVMCSEVLFDAVTAYQQSQNHPAWDHLAALHHPCMPCESVSRSLQGLIPACCQDGSKLIMSDKIPSQIGLLHPPFLQPRIDRIADNKSAIILCSLWPHCWKTT